MDGLQSGFLEAEQERGFWSFLEGSLEGIRAAQSQELARVRSEGGWVAICRCSQPLSGFSARCLEDEHLLQAISKANPANRYMYVMDTRPRVCVQYSLAVHCL